MQHVNRHWEAKASLAFAVGLVAFCVIYPQCVEPDLVPPGAISILWLWLASPFVAMTAGYGVAVLTGERIGKAIFIALCVAFFLDLCLLPVAITIVN
jgi:hypothetical protein